MHSDLALHLVADLLWTGLMVSLPLLAVTMLVGVAIGVLQVVTQVQELTLTFVPKLVAAALVLLAFGPWTLGRLSAFTTRVWSAIPGLF